jgi:cytochrome c oxidase subunit 2
MNLLGSVYAQPQNLPDISTDSPYFWMPRAASTTAGDIDWLYDAMVWLSVLCAVGIFAAMFYFCLKYRAKSRAANERVEKTPDHNTTLEITWSFIPLVITIALFVWGFKGFIDLRTPPKDAMELHVTGQKWKWLFDYPAGFSHEELHVPVDTPVRVIISSVDVLHSLFIPAFRVKMDAVPGRYTDLWFQATETGEFTIECAEYCGTAHSDMLAKTVVHPPGGYEKWIEQQIINIEKEPCSTQGPKLYESQGCATCHSTDGTAKIGPTWKGVFGTSEKLADGSSATVDENYIRESILDPQAKVVAGYTPSMPTYKGKLRDRQITCLVEYIKSLK